MSFASYSLAPLLCVLTASNVGPLKLFVPKVLCPLCSSATEARRTRAFHFKFPRSSMLLCTLLLST